MCCLVHNATIQLTASSCRKLRYLQSPLLTKCKGIFLAVPLLVRTTQNSERVSAG